MIETKKLKSRKDWTSNVNDIFKSRITPALAEVMLASAIENDRKENKLNTKKIEKCVLDDTFYDDVCGNQIGFDKNGNLIDGKHRLRAILNSGKTVTMKVEVGCEHPEYVDSGKSRSVKDQLGYFNLNKSDIDNYAPSIKNILYIRDKRTPVNTGMRIEGTYTIEQIKEFFDKNMDKLEHVTELYQKMMTELKGMSSYKYKNRFEKSIFVSYMYHLIYDKNQKEDRVYRFFKEIKSSKSSKDKHIEMARTIFLHNSIQGKDKFYTPSDVHNLIVRYFNDYIECKDTVKDYRRGMARYRTIEFSSCVFHS
jgi:hypothetical protein